MKKIAYLIYIFCLVDFCYSQQIKSNDLFKNKGVSLKAQTFILFPYNEEIGNSIHDTNFELEYNTIVYGASLEMNYYFNPHFGLGTGISLERINQPYFEYFPLYVSIFSALNESKNSIYTKANIGFHMGDVDKSGFVFRGGLGYRLKVFRNILSNFELTYSYQNIYKSFENSGRPENYYNLESIGLTIGIELN